MNLWEGFKMEEIKQIVIAKIKKGSKTKEFTIKILGDCKLWDGTFTTVKE